MDARAQLVALYHSVHEVLQGTMADVTQEQALWVLPGKAEPIGATYAHVLMSEDYFVNGVGKGGAPLMATTFAGKTGIPSMPPEFPESWDTWARTTKFDLAQMREYATAVFVATEQYFSSAAEAELDRVVDSPVGQMPYSMLMTTIFGPHAANHCGEIAAVKGFQGLKGYPF